MLDPSVTMSVVIVHLSYRNTSLVMEIHCWQRWFCASFTGSPFYSSTIHKAYVIDRSKKKSLCYISYSDRICYYLFDTTNRKIGMMSCCYGNY